jgi:hypothetical protein
MMIVNGKEELEKDEEGEEKEEDLEQVQESGI